MFQKRPYLVNLRVPFKWGEGHCPGDWNWLSRPLDRDVHIAFRQANASLIDRVEKSIYDLAGPVKPVVLRRVVEHEPLRVEHGRLIERCLDDILAVAQQCHHAIFYSRDVLLEFDHPGDIVSVFLSDGKEHFHWHHGLMATLRHNLCGA